MDQLIEFAGNHTLLVAAAAAVMALIVVNELKILSRRSVDLTPVQAVGRINQGALVFDVRSVERYRTGHIVGARSLPMDELDKATQKHGDHKDKPVLVYDDNGTTSQKAVARLQALAFSQVFNLRGGVDAWQRDNYPLEKGR